MAPPTGIIAERRDLGISRRHGHRGNANTGKIEATDADGRAINPGTSATVTNNIGGTIQANGTNGFGIVSPLGSVDVTNAGTIRECTGIAALNAEGDQWRWRQNHGWLYRRRGLVSLDVTNALGATISGGTTAS